VAKAPKLMRVGVLAATKADAQRLLPRLDVAWLDPWPFGLDSPTLHEDLNFAGVSAVVAAVDPGEGLAALLGHLEATSHGDRPVLVVTDEGRDAPWCHAFRLGVVDLVPVRRLAEPVLRSALLELDQRPAMMRGTGAYQELGQLLAHVGTFARTGVLELTGLGARGEVHYRWGRVVHARGVPLDEAGQPALAPNVPWTFREERPPPTAAAGFESLPSAELPLLEAVVEPPPVTAADVVPAETRVLVVDDDPSVLRLVHDFLRHRGFHVSVAAGGPPALQQLAQQAYDVVILDLDMPTIDGWSVLGALRDDVRTWDTQVLLYSAHDQYREVLLRAGPRVHAALPKTTKLTELERYVRELVVPKVAFERKLQGRAVDETVRLDELDRVGLGRALALLERHHVTGLVRGAVGTAHFGLWFVDGRLVQAQATFADGRCTGLDALRLVFTSRPDSLVLEPGTVPPGEGFERHPTGSILSVVVERLAIEQFHLGELAASRIAAVSVNDQLYRLYSGVVPLVHRQVAHALCEEHVSPSDLSHHLGLPQETVTLVLRDLVRRGVIRLSTVELAA
jgi:CheY-like chemotaxis protein